MDAESRRASAHVVRGALFEDEPIDRARDQHGAAGRRKLLGNAQRQRLEPENDPAVTGLGPSITQRHVEWRAQVKGPHRSSERRERDLATRAGREAQSFRQAGSRPEAGESHLQHSDRLTSPLFPLSRGEGPSDDRRGGRADQCAG